MKAIQGAGLVLAFLTLPLLGCGVGENGNGVIVEELREVSAWRRVDVCCGFQIEVARGVDRGVLLEGDENLLPLIRVETRGDTLVIDVDPMTSLDPTQPIRITTTSPELVGAHGSGGSSLTLSGFESPAFEVELSGGSQAVLTGSGRELRAELSGGSQLDARGFPVEIAEVDASGGSIARLRCSSALTGELSGGSEVHVEGRPSQSVDTSGGSKVVLE